MARESESTPAAVTVACFKNRRRPNRASCAIDSNHVTSRRFCVLTLRILNLPMFRRGERPSFSRVR
jgi:hypothetical protein